MGVLNLLLGQGGTAGQALVAQPGVDLISFTGGLATGEKIMASAAQGVRRVALELGGKNPNIVFDGTDFDTVVDNALTAAFLHSGQVCSAGARLIVQDSLHNSFVAELAARADRIRLRQRHGHGDRVRAADLRGAPREGGAVHRARPVRGSRPAGRRQAARLPRPGQGVLPAAHGVRRVPSGDGGGAGRGVRPGGDGRAVQHRGGGHPARQRHQLRPGGGGLDLGRGPGRTGGRRAAPRHGVDQRLPPLPAAGRVGRLRKVGHRPRARPLGLEETRRRSTSTTTRARRPRTGSRRSSCLRKRASQTGLRAHRRTPWAVAGPSDISVSHWAKSVSTAWRIRSSDNGIKCTRSAAFKRRTTDSSPESNPG